MRLIYERSQRVGPDPVDYYVYLWRDGEIDRYVGPLCRQGEPPVGVAH